MFKVKYTHNLNFFFNDSIISSYWCGFIAADGCLIKTKNKNNYRLQLSLQNRDINHLECFVKDIEYTGKIVNHANTSKAVYITLTLKEYEYLQNYWYITPRKSLTLLPPRHLTILNSLAFIKGYIDGDGSTKLTKYNKFNYQILGTSIFLEWIKEILKSTHKIRPKNNIFQIDICGNLAYTSGTLLRNSVNRGLERKWSKLDKVIHKTP